MNATTLTAPIRVNTAGVNTRPSLGRLVAVELRKMLNTRAGFWLQVAMVAITVVAVIASSVTGEAADHTFASVLSVGLLPAAVLLPVVGILLVTSDWTHRTGMITFALVPVRSRILRAKLIASIGLAIAMLVMSVLSPSAAIRLRDALTGEARARRVRQLAALVALNPRQAGRRTARGARSRCSQGRRQNSGINLEPWPAGSSTE